MNYKFFLARRMYAQGEGKRQVAKPAISIAMVGMALGLAVMLVSVCVLIGFKDEVRSKVIGFGSHLQVSNFRGTQSYETFPISANDTLLTELRRVAGVTHVQRFSTKPGIIKTDSDYQGMVLKGVEVQILLSDDRSASLATYEEMVNFITNTDNYSL